MSATGFLDACGFNPASGGTGDFVVSAAVTGYQTPASAGATNGAVYSYRAQSSDLSQWEIGYGAYATGTTTLARTTVVASSTGSKVNFSAPPSVYITALTGDLGNAGLLATGTVPVARLGSGTADSTTFLRGDSSWAAVTLPAEASQADMEAATASTTYVSPRRVISSPYAAKAWCKWGTTTTIDASQGVSSITDNGTGDWTLNWSTAFSSANYAASYSVEVNGTTGVLFRHPGIRNGGQAAGSLRVICFDDSTFGLSDPTKNHVIAFGDQ